MSYLWPVGADSDAHIWDPDDVLDRTRTGYDRLEHWPVLLDTDTHDDSSGKIFSVTVNRGVIYWVCNESFVVFICASTVCDLSLQLSCVCVCVFTSICVCFLPAGTRCSWGLPLLQTPEPDRRGWRPASSLEWCGPSAGKHTPLHHLTTGKTATQWRHVSGRTHHLCWDTFCVLCMYRENKQRDECGMNLQVWSEIFGSWSKTHFNIHQMSRNLNALCLNYNYNIKKKLNNI